MIYHSGHYTHQLTTKLLVVGFPFVRGSSELLCVAVVVREKATPLELITLATYRTPSSNL